MEEGTRAHIKIDENDVLDVFFASGFFYSKSNN